ncbi:SigB/SigF/SigG family RNA polymerase sigma factor [Streptomyces sp. NPDC005840]|uniref:SigB/SigF/SigG family RNA polymerase sigma factor n=1 Tax=Streptomyces sp. NPDC005840 TaxID=3157072 RepID=UPI0033CC9400
MPSTAQGATVHRIHDDAPDTTALFSRLADLPAGPEKDRLRHEAVTAWLPMAHRIAAKFRDRGESVEDLRQVAALGLVKAVDGFDPERGAFESYAVPTITGEVKRHFRDRTWTMRVPRRVQDLRNRVRLARRELSQRPGAHQVTNAEVAAYTGLTEEEVATGMAALESYKTLSLDIEPTSEDGGRTLAESLPAPGSTDAFDIVVDREAARRELCQLPQRERAILYMRFFEDLTQSRIAERLGISQMHVSRLVSSTCAQVRARVLEEAPQRAAA